MSVLVHGAVRQFEFLERDYSLPGQLVSAERRVWMSVNSRSRCRVGLAGDDPRRPMISVPVSLVIDRCDVEVDVVAMMWLKLAAEAHPQRRKHPPTFVRHNRIVFVGLKLRPKLL